MGSNQFRSQLLRAALVASMVWLVALASAKTDWLGIYMMGQKIGYSVTTTEPSEWQGAEAEKSESRLEIGAKMLGSAMKISVASTTISDAQGRLKMLTYTMSSAGRSQQTTAYFEGNTIRASMIAGTSESAKVLTVPPGKLLVDDPVAAVSQGKIFPADKGLVIFSPETMELVDINITIGKPEPIEVKGQKLTATPILIDDPRSPSTVYLSSKGDLVKVTGPMGLEMIPESESEATADLDTADIDLANASMVRPIGKFDSNADQIHIRISSESIKNLPSDRRQNATKVSGGYDVILKKDALPNKDALITSAQRNMDQWLGAEPRVPSDSDRFKKLAREVIGNETRVAAAADKIHEYVHGLMGVNAGIGVMREAGEILDSREGVCRDHAILAGTLLRSAGIPTRFVNGLVFAMGAFYYHAWVEYWDGSQWIGLDTTREPKQLGVGYIKTAQGSVGQALNGFLLDGAKIEVIKG